MNIAELYKFIEQFPDTRTCKYGFTNPHSYRGYYEEAAVEPQENTTIKEMKESIERLLSEEFMGYKGGEYTYEYNTKINLAYYGCTSDDDSWIETLLSIAGVNV